MDTGLSRSAPRAALALATAAALAGCTCPTLLVEAEHISHPTAGWPVEKQRLSEDEVTQLSTLLRWRHGQWYADAGFGANLYGKHGGGFWGPALTGTVRVGREIPLVRQ